MKWLIATIAVVILMAGCIGGYVYWMGKQEGYTNGLIRCKEIIDSHPPVVVHDTVYLDIDTNKSKIP